MSACRNSPTPRSAIRTSGRAVRPLRDERAGPAGDTELPRAAGHHAHQHAIAPGEMMPESAGGVQACETEQRIGQQLMNLLGRMERARVRGDAGVQPEEARVE